MPKFNPDNINVHDMMLEDPAPEAELPFDVERDITDKDWKGIEDLFERLKLDNNWPSLLSVAEDIKILDPSHKLDFDALSTQHLEDLVEKSRHTSDWRDWSSKAMQMKLIDPAYDLKTDAKTLKRMEGYLEEYRQEGNWFSYFLAGKQMQIINPKQKLNLDETARQAMKNQLIQTKGRLGHIRSFDDMVLAAKIFFPDEAPVLSALEWRVAADDLSACKFEGRWASFLGTV